MHHVRGIGAALVRFGRLRSLPRNNPREQGPRRFRELRKPLAVVERKTGLCFTDGHAGNKTEFDSLFVVIVGAVNPSSTTPEHARAGEANNGRYSTMTWTHCGATTFSRSHPFAGVIRPR